ncbi:MAG: amidohydrolase family protein, partial [Candidatus Heimdallarchaeota archaeon]
MDTIIKSGTIVTVTDEYVADIGIKDGKIVSIGADLGSDGTIIDAKGKLVLPGMIDAHVHLQLPFGGTVSVDSFETGTRAAAAGGVTTVIDFAIQMTGQNLKEVIKARKAEADGNVHVDYSLHGGIGNWNEQTRDQIKEIIKEGISSFK